ncbi:MAG: Translation initiation factor 3 subunit b [Phylliscum demangeonii]|nr:MAG: Translation initiation factor 3 subunit b [Phylliscum demangeonii]
MAPGFKNLAEEDLDEEEEEEEIDFTDLKAQHDVRLEEGLDTFVVVDGLPIVPDDNKVKLVKFLLRKLNAVGHTREEAVFMPSDEKQMSQGFAFVEYETPAQAAAAVKALHGTPLDKKHTLAVNKLTDIDRYGREGRIDDEYQPPAIPDFEEGEHLRWWIGEEPNGLNARDQFIMFRGDSVGVFWNKKHHPPEAIVDRQHWTESFVQWSPMGTYLTSMHQQGVQLWGGNSWKKQKRFIHPGVNLVDFSPSERYLVTWSNRPIEVDENHPVLSMEEDGKNYVVWDVDTGKPLRSFPNIDLDHGTDEAGNPVKRKMQWPAFKWSADDQYVARITPGQSISVYELPKMSLLDRTAIKIEGVVDFEWAPASPQRDGIKTYEQLFSYWTPEIGSNPAKVGLMSIPSKEIVRARNLFNVSDAKLHWQSQAHYVCVKVDRHSKSKKSLATNLEIFRVREKGVPVEVIDTIKDTVINFAWEPQGDRFVLITTAEVVAGATAVPPKTSVSFFCPERSKGTTVGNFKMIRTVEKKNSNAIYWAPKGRFVIVATVHSQQSFELDFWDLDFEGERTDPDKDLTANLQLMATADHYGVTDVEWDPTGRYVATAASMWKSAMENGYHLYDFKGTLLREEPVDRFKQWAWRPRPPTLLSKEEQKNIRRMLREYSRIFDEQDQYELDEANMAVVETRRRLLNEWHAWRAQLEEELGDERRERGLPADPNAAPAATKGKGKKKTSKAAGAEGANGDAGPSEDETADEANDEGADEAEDAVVEEIVNEIVDETEEIVP